MRTSADVISLVADFLNKEKVSYVLVGAYAVAAWGEPRASFDIDMIVALDKKSVSKLERFFKDKGFQTSGDIDVALKEKSHFTIFDSKSDFSLDMKGVYSRMDENSLKRSQSVNVEGVKVRIASPEDVIVSKVLFGSERDLHDAKTILLRKRGSLDEDYIKKACKELGILDAYLKLRSSLNI